ncbi:hypothetical protein J2S78_002014 [Salibacterium salarium]|uniref:hypothetical protein n=1 Tax=Salibacterium salarium TaxID=284579 RepID=UPI002787922D|nr:hypothetical protein [Salibacterium salarium]MDQ0299594.1 hypothetical protein [Salibacterium salarium]
MDWASGTVLDWFFLTVIALIYWNVDKHIGVKLFIVVTLTVYIHGLIKNTFSPIPAESSFTFSFPAREVQAATSFFGYLIPEISKRGFTVLSSLFLLVISIITLLYGDRSLQDVIMGILIGIFIVYAVYRSMEWMGSVPEPIILSISLVLPSSLLLLFPEGAPYAGFLLGSGIGFSFEKMKGRIVPPHHTQNKIIMAILGLFGLVIIAYARTWMPSTTLIEFLHAALIGCWITYINPLLSIKLRLTHREGNLPVK